MCRRITCEKCGRPSFAGCGLHIESVLGDVPPAQRCQGHSATDKATVAAPAAGPGVPGSAKGPTGRSDP
ncbi:MAG TPA: hypothetical protein VGL59_24025 [Polyangia bacterium]